MPVQTRASQAQARSGLTFGVEPLQRRPKGLGNRRLEPATRPGVVRVDPPEAVTNGGDHAGVVTGTSSSLSVRCGSLSGASSGSDIGSGTSMTLTGLLVNPMVQPSFQTSTEGRSPGQPLFNFLTYTSGQRGGIPKATGFCFAASFPSGPGADRLYESAHAFVIKREARPTG